MQKQETNVITIYCGNLGDITGISKSSILGITNIFCKKKIKPLFRSKMIDGDVTYLELFVNLLLDPTSYAHKTDATIAYDRMCGKD